LTEKRKYHGEYNENWEAEIAAFDADMRKQEETFRKTHLVMDEEGYPCLNEEENELIALYLKGSSCEDIAEQLEIEIDIVESSIELIKAKLSIED
jgi:DNA-binding NarL/FixJ family response regulator